MGSKIIVFGDTHIRHEEPFSSALEEFFSWCHEQEWNNSENIMIHVGDFFHTNQPTPKDYSLAHWFLKKLHFNKKFIMAGNGIHEYNRVKKMYAIDPLLYEGNVQLIKNPLEWQFKNLNLLFLPWIPSNLYNVPMKEYYENYTPKEKPDYVFGHFAHKEFFGTEIDISHISGKKFMGHIHVPDDDYIGVNVISRYDEKGMDCSLIMIDEETYTRIPIPKFLDYETIEYGEQIEDDLDHYLIYDITDAPSKDKVYEKYENLHIRQVHLKKDFSREDSDTNSIEEHSSINDFFNQFAKETKLDSNVKNILKKVI